MLVDAADLDAAVVALGQLDELVEIEQVGPESDIVTARDVGQVDTGHLAARRCRFALVTLRRRIDERVRAVEAGRRRLELAVLLLQEVARLVGEDAHQRLIDNARHKVRIEDDDIVAVVVVVVFIVASTAGAHLDGQKEVSDGQAHLAIVALDQLRIVVDQHDGQLLECAHASLGQLGVIQLIAHVGERGEERRQLIDLLVEEVAAANRGQTAAEAVLWLLLLLLTTCWVEDEDALADVDDVGEHEAHVLDVEKLAARLYADTQI